MPAPELIIGNRAAYLRKAILTPEGRALQGRARPIPRAIERATGLSNEEIEDLRGRLDDLRASLRRALSD